MKKLALLVALLLCAVSFFGCGSSDYNQKDLDQLAQYGIPKELLMPGNKPEIQEHSINYNTNKPFAEVEAFYQKYLEANKATEEFNMDAATLAAQGIYEPAFLQEGLRAWLYQGTLEDGTPVSILLKEIPINISSYTSVMVLYNEKIFALPEGMENIIINEDGSITGMAGENPEATSSPAASSEVEMITPQTEYNGSSASENPAESSTAPETAESTAPESEQASAPQDETSPASTPSESQAVSEQQ